MRPYVGITGISSLGQARLVAQQHLDAGFSQAAGYQGMVGYCVTGEIMNGAPVLSPRYVDPATLKDILLPDQSFGLNALHFLPVKNDDSQFVRHLDQLLLRTGIFDQGLCRHVQVNYGTEYISPQALKILKQLMPDLHFILQVGRKDLTEKTVSQLRKQLAGYADYVSMFLIDPSQGQGKSFDAESVRELVSALHDDFRGIAIGFAGGLSPDNLAQRLSEFASLLQAPFSIDVESGVRDETDTLSMDKTTAFINRAATTVLRGASPAFQNVSP